MTLRTFHFLLLSSLFCGAGAIPPLNKVRNFTNAYMTSFLTDDQIYNTSNLIAESHRQNVGQTATYSAVSGYLAASLTPSQMDFGANMMLCLFNQGLTTKTMIVDGAEQTFAAWKVALVPFFNQTQNKVNSMVRVGRGVNAIHQQVYRIYAQWSKLSNACLMQNIAHNHMTLKNWNSFRACLDSIIYYTKCGN